MNFNTTSINNFTFLTSSSSSNRTIQLINTSSNSIDNNNNTTNNHAKYKSWLFFTLSITFFATIGLIVFIRRCVKCPHFITLMEPIRTRNSISGNANYINSQLHVPLHVNNNNSPYHHGSTIIAVKDEEPFFIQYSADSASTYYYDDEYDANEACNNGMNNGTRNLLDKNVEEEGPITAGGGISTENETDNLLKPSTAALNNRRSTIV